MASTTGGVPRAVLRAREERAWELCLKLYTHERIANDLGVDRSTVSKILKRLSTRAIDKLDERIREEKVLQIEQLHHIADEAMLAWEASKGAKKSVSRRTHNSGRPLPPNLKAPEEMTVTSQDQDGDPRFLITAMKALQDIRAICGFGAGTVEDREGPASGPVNLEVVMYMPEAPLNRDIIDAEAKDESSPALRD